MVFNQFDGIFQDGQVSYTQKIKLKKPGVFHGVHIILGYDAAAFGVKLQGHEFSKRFWPDNHAGGVDRNMPGAALHFLSLFDHFGHDRIGFMHLGQFRGYF